jgi:nitrous oxidase accessory protein
MRLLGTRPSRRRRAPLLRIAPLALAMAVGCESGPQPIVAGRDRCAFCLMGVAEERFAAELITRTRKPYTFDSIECLAGYIEFSADAGDVRSVWVTDYDSPPRLIAAAKAYFLQADAVRSPMGLGIAAFASRAARDAAKATLGGQVLDWNGVRRAVREHWPDGPPHGSEEAGAHAAHAGRRDTVDARARALGHARGELERDAAGALIVAAGTRTTLSEAIRQARPGDRIVLRGGTWREPTLVIDKPLELVGEGRPVLDGEGNHQILTVTADDVTIRGLVLRNVGTTHMGDRAAIRVEKAKRCRIEDNHIEGGFFGIYLAGVQDCEIRGNRMAASNATESSSGNGIHLWASRGVIVEDNVMHGFRDGIYFEFVRDSRVTANTSERNLRYGLHFMFSDSCRYERNVFRSNGAGVAVMYTHQVDMVGNDFADNWGAAAFGLLLKEIRDSRIQGNRFTGNSVALFAEGSDRLTVTDNDFGHNGWAIKLLANSERNQFAGNNFVGNTFDVATNSRQNYSRFAGNYWDAYRGYDLDHNGMGDVPYRPVRLFSLLVERNEPSLILLRSFLVQLLDAAEAVIPALTPETLTDDRPLMAPAPRKGKAT